MGGERETHNAQGAKERGKSLRGKKKTAHVFSGFWFLGVCVAFLFLLV